jgi:hypothetical protein
MLHSYAVQDRIDISNLSDEMVPTCLPSPECLASSLLPTVDDDSVLHNNFATLISRVLKEHYPFFKQNFEDVVVQHIPHLHDREMSQKSEIVRCCCCCVTL